MSALIKLSKEQEIIVLEDITETWSPHGIANRYSMQFLKKINKIFQEAIEIKKEK